MTQNSGSRTYGYSTFDKLSNSKVSKNLRTLLNYICKKNNDYECNDGFSDIFGEDTITFNETAPQNKSSDDEKTKIINIFNDEFFISHVTESLDLEALEKNSIIDALTQTAIYARIIAGIKCCDGKYIDLEGLRAALTVMGVDFNLKYDSIIEEKLYKIKNLDIKDFKNSEM